MTALALALVWTGVRRGGELPAAQRPLVFVLALAAVGLDGLGERLYPTLSGG